jgi:hypothetical protein
MKTLIVCLALFGVAFALPIDDEKHRWTLVPDQEGRMHLLDMNPIELEPEPAFNPATDIIFLLFTRRNTAAQRITLDMNTVRNSQWAAAQGARFIIHGWNSNQNTAMNSFIRAELLAHANHNVVVGKEYTLIVRTKKFMRFFLNSRLGCRSTDSKLLDRQKPCR